MNYELALDKKAVVSVIAGWVVISVLLFLAGWIIGRQWPMTESASTTSGATEAERAELPKEPVLNEEAATPKANVPRNTEPKEKPPAVPTTSPEAAAQAQASAEQVTDGSVAIISEAASEAATNEAATTEPEYVTVQVGVFLDEKDASHLLHEIERKGYAPTFFSGRDAEARQWYAVRIGAYSDKQQAANAAANFTKQEKMKAVVRPLNSL